MGKEISTKLQTQIKALPDNPGVYQFYDESGKILYVGKAKNLKNRVSSYFNKDRYENGKTKVLVSKIADIQYIVVNNEMEALLLENSLIKKHQPRYNINLKDDKTYPYLVIKNEAFPRIFPTRRVIKDGSEYFGPYASVKMMRTVLDLIKQLTPLRSCNLNLADENIKKGKYKVCLEYHIGNCKGPCEGLQTAEDYNEYIKQARQIIRGDIQEVKSFLKSKMNEYAEKFEFEEAQLVKNKLEELEKFSEKTVVVSTLSHPIDVFSYVEDNNISYVNFLKLANGSIIQSFTLELKHKLDETKEEILALAITELRQRYQSLSREIVVPFIPDMQLENVEFTIPQRGDKRKLLELSEQNVKFYIKDKWKQISIKDPEKHTNRVLEQMRKDLRMQELPVHIECFDNSNFQGAYPVAAMVCFKNAKASKKDYRHYNIKTVEGPDDFASMKEVVYRRYKMLLEENQPLPQLIIIDGGKGQLSSALESLDKLGLRGKITIIGIAKRLEEIYFPGDNVPLYIDKKSETLKIIQQIRNEAHRFGITHYRKRHRKGLIRSELTDIEGIGEATAQLLLKHFKSVKKIKEATLDEISEIVGNAKAKIVFEHFHK